MVTDTAIDPIAYHWFEIEMRGARRVSEVTEHLLKD